MARVFTVHTPLGPEVLKFKALSGHEQLSRLFEFRLEMLGVSPDIPVDSLLGQNVTVEVETQALGQRYLNGEVTRFALVGRDGRYYRYEAIVRPWVWYMTRASDCRIFQQMDAPTILSEVLGKYPYVMEKRLTGAYRTWDYCVQYQETDFNFVSRLMEHEGIYYFFEHGMGQLKLILADSPGAHQPLPEYADIPYISPDAATFADEEHVQSWIVSKEVDPGGFVTDDFDFRKPRAKLQQWNLHAFEHPNAEYRIYDYPGGYTEISEGEFYTKVRLEELQAPHEVLQGQSDARGIAPGYLFNLYRCPRADQNREYLIVGVEYFWRENPYATAGDGGTRFQFTLNCQDSSVPYRPQRATPKPLTNGPQTAVVVGPKDDEIYTDKYGRVKVQFHWDRYGEADENSSCWIRVSSSWAGNSWGQISLPRIGQEVIVDFINGDPDYPIIIGRVYNADHMPPYDLPKYQEYSTIKSHSTKKGSNTDWNELRFVDYKGKEQVFIHANWRMDVRVKWNMYKTVKESYHCQIHKSHYRTVGGECDIYIKGKLYERADDEMHITAGGAVKIVAEKTYQLSSDESIEVNAKDHITIESSTDVTLRVNGNFVKVDASGVTIQGTMVKINSGGMATPVSEFDADHPVYASEADDGTPGYLDRPKKGGGGWKRGSSKGGQHHAPMPPPPPLPPVPKIAETPASETAALTAEQIDARLNEASFFSRDDTARAIVQSMSREQLRNLPDATRQRLKDELNSGWTSDDDKAALRKIWQAENEDTINRALKDQRAMLEARKADLAKGDDAVKQDLKTWFGKDDDGTRKTVADRIDKELDLNKSTTIDNFAPADPPKINRFAYVYRGDKDHTIYLDDAFFNAPATGSDSKAGTLVHEMSHFSDIGDTDDNVYGSDKSKNLAKTDPEKALENADSFEYFVERAP